MSRKAVARDERTAKGPARKPAAAVAAGFELRELQQLISLVQDTGIGELELTAGGRSVRISATASGLAPATAPPCEPQCIMGTPGDRIAGRADPPGSTPPFHATGRAAECAG